MREAMTVISWWRFDGKEGFFGQGFLGLNALTKIPNPTKISAYLFREYMLN